jgi:alanine racemase
MCLLRRKPPVRAEQTGWQNGSAMPRPIQATIHADALARNLARARAAAPDARVWAVVKANAYGHGIERAYDSLRAADGFALLDFDEARRVRELGWRGPVLMLEGCFDARDVETCARLDLRHTVHCDAQIDWLAAAKLAKPQHVVLKLNSGMNRLGFAAAAFRAAYQRLAALPQVDAVTLATHFADADGAAGVEAQLAAFEAATEGLAGERSLSNSAALLRHGALRERMAEDWVRPGILLYGSSTDFPAHDIAHWNLRPAMTLSSRLIATQRLQRGDRVGYGSAFTADAPMAIGVVACGYADGYPRHAPTGTPVLVDGRRTRIVGRVSMDMVTVDLTPVPDARLGSEVTLWGRGPGGAVLAIDDVAHAAGTVGYELMCGLAQRVPVVVAP